MGLTKSGDELTLFEETTTTLDLLLAFLTGGNGDDELSGKRLGTTDDCRDSGETLR